MDCYRIVTPRYAHTALTGEGARLYGGRWNPAGWRCVYAAGSRSLAALEMLVQLTGRSRGLVYRLLTIDVPDDLVAEVSMLPDGWDATPAGGVPQSVGSEWLAAGKTAALKVPSVIIPEETNFLLNPQAPGFAEIRVIAEREFQLDLRLAAEAT